MKSRLKDLLLFITYSPNMEEQKTKTEGIGESASDLVDHATDFLETYYKYIAINVAQTSINLASGAINFVVLVFLCLQRTKLIFPFQLVFSDLVK